jgi:tetratricopeptide (TPR) repeat protein
MCVKAKDGFVRVVCLLLAIWWLSGAEESGYVGSAVCAGCHKNIAQSQARTNMARAWHGLSTLQIPASYHEKLAEGPPPAIDYSIQRSGQLLEFQVQMPGEPALDFPVESLIGGDRHGFSFLLRVPALKGSALARAPLVEARYFHYAEQNRLALELGFPKEKPTNYETALGRVLTPHLEKRCLDCHGAPRTHGTRVASGIDCESCHGPGAAHLAALSSHSRDLAILNPKKLPAADQMRPCSQCHAGGADVVEDPMPDDTLISDQVTAMKDNECWRQSGGALTCMDCHDPHRDSPHTELVTRSEKTCLRCHGAAVANRAGLCPVNRTTGCVGCHMPDQVLGAFIMADHWIRVHPEQKVEVAEHNPAWQTTIIPKHLFLRMMTLEDREKASAIRQQLLAGASFFELARANSLDHDSAPNGGYLGDLEAGKFDPAWSAAALKLQPGEISEVIENKGKYVILQRLPRNFREDAEAVFNQAMELRKQGKPQECINQLLESLKIYPHLLRGLTWLGAMFGQSGNPNVSIGILTIATKLYPEDGGVHYNLALAYGAKGDPAEISEYQRAIEIDPDLALAYLNWGAALFAKGEYEEAIKVYREGIQVNPLIASLHYNLGLALEQMKKTAESEAEMVLAAKINPSVGAR